MEKVYPKQLWAILAKGVSVDQQTNSASIFNVIEELRIGLHSESNRSLEEKGGTLVTFQEPITLISLFHMGDKPESAKEFDVRVEIQDPEKKKIASFDLEVVPQGKRRHRAIMQFNQMPVTSNGEYHFVFSTRIGSGPWDTQAEIPLEIFLSAQNDNEKG